MTIIYRLINRNANEAIYADPSARMDTLKVKVNVQPKKAGSLTVYNAKSSINMVRTRSVTAAGCAPDACSPNQERLALGWYISGSLQSEVELDSLCDDFLAALAVFRTDMKAGFLKPVDTVTLVV